MKTYFEPAREVKVRAEVDILVVGGGPAGIMAAEAAAKDKNLKVMLIEQRGYMGGNLTIGLPILSFLGPKGNQVVKGGAQKFIDRYTSNGWMVGRTKMQDWKAAVRTWEQNEYGGKGKAESKSSFDADDFFNAALEKTYGTKKGGISAPSHKEVYTYFVGTGVLDCPKRQKLICRKQRLTPTDFQGLSGVVYSVR